jgi:hypothetical protein
MKYHVFLLFCCLHIIHQNSFCMETKLDHEVPKSLLKPWDERTARSGSLVAYQDGEIFRYARLHGKEGKDDMYSIIVATLYKKNKEITTQGKVVSGSRLRLIAQNQ